MRNTCTDNSGWSGWSILVKKKSVIISYIRCRPIQGSLGGSHICSFFKIFFLFLKSYKIKLVTASTKLSIYSKNKQLLSFTYHKIHPSKVYNREGNGTPLQYSCPENPMDGGPWWAAVYGVAQSRIRLKRLSSSSSRITQYVSFFLFHWPLSLGICCCCSATKSCLTLCDAIDCSIPGFPSFTISWSCSVY